jgi:glycosyltransferase involved in cell wall biosynthesis
MRVLMVTQAVDITHPLLGFTHGWIEALARQVDHLHVVALIAGERSLPANVTLHGYGPPGAPDDRLGRLFFFHRAFARLLLSGHVDTALVHMIPRWVIMAHPYAAIRRVPVVLWYTHGATSTTLRWAHRLAAGVATASPESYPLWGERKAVALGHGIDTGHFSPPASPGRHDTLRILAVGRLSPVKRYEVLIEAARILLERGTPAPFTIEIVGGPARATDEVHARELRRMVAAYGLEQCISFAGAVPYNELPSHYRAADLLASPSDTGGMDKVILEAMACGVPAVTCNETFAPLLERLPVPLLAPRDDGTALAARMAGIMALAVEHPGEMAELRRMVRALVVQEHGVDGLATRLAQLLRNAR